MSDPRTTVAPTRYRKLPVVIEAMQYHPGPGGNCEAIAAFLGAESTEEHDPQTCDPETIWIIGTLEGEMAANPGDWVIHGVQGEFYPCKPDAFAATYEPAGGAR